MQSQAGAAFDRKFAKLLRDGVEALRLREKQEKDVLERDLVLLCALLRQVDAADGIQSSEDAIRKAALAIQRLHVNKHRAHLE